MGWDNSLDPTTAPYGVIMSASDYWKKMSPEERSAEMKKRMGKRNGKKKSTKRAKKSNRTKRGAHNGATQTQEEHTLEGEVKYLYGKVETLIEFRAHSNGIPFATLAEGVANLLRR